METRKCPACAEDIQADAAFCPLCGERLSDNGQKVPAARSTDMTEKSQPVVPQSSARQSAGGRRGGNFRMSPLAIMAVAIVVIAVGGYFIFGSSKKSDDQSATDWNKLAISYLAANSIDEDDAYICDDDERHCVYYLEKDNYEGGGSRIVKYDLQSGRKRDISDWYYIADWGTMTDNRSIWVHAGSGGPAVYAAVYNTFSDKWNTICGTDGSMKFLGDKVIRCEDIDAYGDTVALRYYDWDGDEIEPNTYVGMIGSYSVVMELVSDGEEVFGSYYYRRYGSKRRMELDGAISNRRILLYGYSYDSGDRRLIETISGVAVGDDIEGTWTNISNGNTLKVHLSLQ